ncbi:homeobox protein Mohawk-like [Brachionichthys hirsutus]|uniref:homeobox protein Mohawk-like n=1 Tax=Brachionichthys hirsutus TaxID=412623 RepID=UPI0036048753
MAAAAAASDALLGLEGNRRAEERGDCPQSGEKTDLLRCRDETRSSSAMKYRRYGSRPGGVKVRHKRQVLQDMARPLKHWLYKHRDNPYPTKTEKVLLALGSRMTLVQVSNWFANARRRLKNTVRQPDLSWALRIKLYNQYVQGNAERLSVCSDAADSDDDERPGRTAAGPSRFGDSPHDNGLQKRGSVLAMADDGASPPSKYKSGLLNRYLNDTLRHMMAAEAGGAASARGRRRSHFESFSSNESDRDVVSPAPSFESEANIVYQMDTIDYTSTKRHRERQRRVHQGWREIHAAVALTSLAQGQSCAPGLVREPPFSLTRTCTADGMRAAGPAARTSRIIQRSSHISEVQTVNVALAKGV